MPGDIKLQLLLNSPAPSRSEVDELVSKLSARGIQTTAVGQRTISCKVSAEDFKTLFGFAVTSASGFTAGPAADTALPLPPELSPNVALATLVSRHQIIK
jgi:hypothetical protein